MRKLTSLPSTRAQEVLYTDFSKITSPTTPSTTISKIVNFVKNSLKKRVVLYERDVEQIYEIDPGFFIKFFDAYCAQELWQALKTKQQGQCLKQKQIIGFFSKLIINMTKEKNLAVAQKNIKKFSELKSSIQWTQDRIIEIQEQIRKRILEKSLKKKQIEKQLREIQYKEQQQMLKRDIFENSLSFASNLQKTNRQNLNTVIKNVNKEIQEHMYSIRPSKGLRKAKEISLLAKLSPFKEQKKRPYEFRTLNQKLKQTAELDKQRMSDQIRHIKKIQSEKVKRRQNISNQRALQNINIRNQSALARLQNQREERQKSQNIKIQQLIKNTKNTTNQRVKDLRNSLKAYSQKDQSNQIRKIMQDHHNTIQFVTRIQDIEDTSNHAYLSQSFGDKYSTIPDLRSESKKKKIQSRYSDEYMKRRILKKFKNSIENEEEDSEDNTRTKFRRKKSLVDMYDEDLNPKVDNNILTASSLMYS